MIIRETDPPAAKVYVAGPKLSQLGAQPREGFSRIRDVHHTIDKKDGPRI
jgi:hypothetical protein